jgi:hypothetical protein
MRGSEGTVVPLTRVYCRDFSLREERVRNLLSGYFGGDGGMLEHLFPGDSHGRRTGVMSSLTESVISAAEVPAGTGLLSPCVVLL